MANDIGCCKYLMFFFNLLIFLSGVALLAVGIWVVVGADSFRSVISEDPRIFNAVYIIIAVGALLFLVGFLGCCGAIKENKFMLGAFFFLILIIFILEIVGGVLAFVYYDDAEQVALRSMKSYNSDQTVKSAWDEFQRVFKCCGVNGAKDWVEAGVLVGAPAPCLNSGSITNLLENAPSCSEVVQSYFWVLGGIACGVLVVELLAMIFACCLYQNVRKERYA